MALSFLGIFLTLVSLCSVTWAWFRTDVSSSDNTLRTATSNIAFTVTSGDTQVTPSASAPDGNPVYTFEKDVPYTIHLTIGETDTAHAYCAVVINGHTYYSTLLSTSSGVLDLHFTLQFSSTQSGVEILPRWGIPHAEPLLENGRAYLDLTETDPSQLGTPLKEPAVTTEPTEPTTPEDSPEETTDTQSSAEITPEETNEDDTLIA